jgi:hypothetical protein
MSLLLLLNTSVQNGGNSPPPGDLIPTSDDVASLLLDRTTISGGSDAGVFTGDTTPTADQVQHLIELATSAVLIELPDTVPTALYGTVKTVVALTAAILVETSDFSQQVQQNTARIEVYERLVESHMAALRLAAAGNVPGGSETNPRAYGVPIGTVTAASSPFSTDLLA